MRWPLPRWRSRWPPPPRPRTSGPWWTSCGGSGSSAPATPPAGPAARTRSPSRGNRAAPRRREPGGARPGQPLAPDLPLVWAAPSTTPADRKELLRILIEDITVNVAGDSELVDVTITWAGGHQTTGRVVRPVGRLDQLSYFPALLARVTELAAAGRNSRQIADVLNAEGFRPPKRTSRFSDGQVRT